MLTIVNIRIITLHFCLFLLVSFVLFFSFNPFLPQEYALPDAIISGLVFSAVTGMLRLVVKYSHFHSLSFLQRVIIYTALGIIYLIIRIGLECLFLYAYLPLESNWEIFIPVIPVRLLIALMAYILVLTIYDRKYAAESPEDRMLEPVFEIPEPEDSKEEAEKINYLERVTVKNGHKVEIIPVEEIIFLEAEGDYVKIHTTDGRFLKEQTMKYFENSLSPQQFVRIHRSYILNVNFIVQIELYEKQSQLVKLKNGIQLKVSRSGYATLKKVLDL